MCAPVNREVLENDEHLSVDGMVQTITRAVRETGEETRGRDDANCQDLAREVLVERSTFNAPIAEGVAGFDKTVELLDNHDAILTVVEYTADGKVKVAEVDVPAVELTTGQSLTSISTEVVAHLDGVRLHADGTYKANFSIDLGGEAGVTYVLFEQGIHTEEFSDVNGNKATLRVEVSADGTVKAELLVNQQVLADGSTYNGHRVTLTENGAGALTDLTLRL